MNALKHGFNTEQSCIDVFEEALFPDFVDGMTHDLNPQNQEELALSDTIITCHWRMRRVLRLETERLRSFLENADDSLGNSILQGDRYKGICALSMHESRIQRTLTRAYKELREIRKNGANRRPQVEEPAIEIAPTPPAQYLTPDTRHPEIPNTGSPAQTNPTEADLDELINAVQETVHPEAETPRGDYIDEQTQTEFEKTNPMTFGTKASEQPHTEDPTPNTLPKRNPTIASAKPEMLHVEHGTSNTVPKTQDPEPKTQDHEPPAPFHVPSSTLQGALPGETQNPEPKAQDPTPFTLTPHQEFSLGRLRVYQRGLHRAGQMPPGPEKDKAKWFNYNWILQVKATEDLSKIPPGILEFDPVRDLPPAAQDQNNHAANAQKGD